MKLSAGILATCIAVANGLHIGEDSNTSIDASSTIGLEIHKDGSINNLHLETRKLKTSKTGKGSKDYLMVIEAINNIIDIEDNCQAGVDELEECYHDHQAKMSECVVS
jgi:hypothetical protein